MRPAVTFDQGTGQWYQGQRAQVGSRVLGQWLAQRDGLQRAGFGRHERNYAAAQVNRLTHGWSTTSLSANAAIHGSLDALRARSRQLATDNPHMRKFLAMVRDNIVGPQGIVLQSRIVDPSGQPDQLACDAVEAAWADFNRRGVIEVSGKFSGHGLQQLVAISVARDGEVLLRKVRGTAAGNPYGLAYQVLDVDRIDTAYNRAADSQRQAVRMGVQIDQWGREVGLWLRTRHPGDAWATSVEQGSEQRIFLGSADYIRVYVAERPEQLRGVPWAHASMKTLHDNAGYQEAAIIASRVGASKMGFFTTPDGQAEVLSTGTEGGGAPGAEGDSGALVMDADPGVLQSLPEGVGFTPFNPEYPQTMYAAFLRQNVRDIATGLCVAYHSLGNDLEGVSFSSIRSGTLEERDAWMVLQQWFIDELMERIQVDWIASALAMGRITLPNGSALPLTKLAKFAVHVWQPRRWEWVDPEKDISADAMAVAKGWKSPQQVAAKMGGDLQDVLLAIKQANDMAERMGVPIRWGGEPAAAPAAKAAAPAPAAA